MTDLFASVINSPGTGAGVSVGEFLICVATAILLGVITAFTLTIRNNDSSRNFIVTTAIMPVVITVVVLIVNSLAAGIAIAGLFNLIRFRSVPGTSREITNILMSAVVGVSLGIGYIAYAVIFSMIIIIVNLIMAYTKVGTTQAETCKELRITVPESLDFEGIFDDIFDKYTTSHVVDRIKTTNMGSMYQISYKIKMKDKVSEKEMIDEIRVRNGNLDIICARFEFDNRKYL